MVSAGDRPTAPPPPPPPPATCTKPQPGPSPIRRLTRTAYNNTVRDLLGDTSNPADAFPPEEIGNGFGNDAASLRVSRLLAEQYLDAAIKIADRATADAAKLNALASCDSKAMGGEEACARAFIEGFVSRAYRRPVEGAERDRLMAVYTAGRIGGDFKTGVHAVIVVTLQSPQFLYRIEAGAGGATAGVAKLSAYEMASRLSYFFWGTMPDGDLLTAARMGRLSTRDEVAGQAKRLLDNPRAREMLRAFNSTFLGLGSLDRLNKNTKAFPAFTPDLGPLFKKETETFLEKVIWEGEGDLTTLLTAPYSYMDAKLAKFYGLPAPAGAGFQKVMLDPTRRAGVLTQSSILAATTPGQQTNPVSRGVFVRGHFFCDHPPDPPPALMVMEPQPDPKATTRESFIAHLTDPTCRGCHALMDPIGFAFENYDGLGTWRDKDNGRPVDARGEIVGTDVPGTFNGAVELGQRISKSAQMRRCFVGQWFSYVYGRPPTEADACTRASLEETFQKSGGKIQQLLLALTQTDAFMYREVTP